MEEIGPAKGRAIATGLGETTSLTLFFQTSCNLAVSQLYFFREGKSP